MLQSKVLQVNVIGVLAHAGDYILLFIVQDLPEPSSYVKLFTLIPIALWGDKLTAQKTKSVYEHTLHFLRNFKRAHTSWLILVCRRKS